jgi:tRNA 2-thiouridine synthesizing protein E
MNNILDKHGFLQNGSEWNSTIAKHIALQLGIKLTDSHWEIINLIREFYQLYQLAPSQRPLVNYIAKKLGKEKGNSIYMMKLFLGSPAVNIAKIAGLPKPDNCF